MKYISVGQGQVVDLPEDIATQLISDGLAVAYNLVEPTGTISITANGTNIDVAQYAKADVAVPNPAAGTISITANGTNIDVSAYAKADVAVPNPSTGTRNITSNGDYDVTSYASAHVNVAGASWAGSLSVVNNHPSAPLDISYSTASGTWNTVRVAANGGTTTIPMTTYYDSGEQDDGCGFMLSFKNNAATDLTVSGTGISAVALYYAADTTKMKGVLVYASDATSGTLTFGKS